MARGASPARSAIEAEHDVVRACVRETLARPARRRLRGRNGDEFLGPPPSRASTEDTRVVDVVGKPRCVLEKLPHCDLVPLRDEARQPSRDGVVQAQHSVLDEVEHQCCDEGLRDAPGPEPQVCAHGKRTSAIGKTAGLGSRRTSLADDDEGAGRPLLHHAVE